MSIFTAIGIAVVLLYSWLAGHWFARVVMFLLCVAFGLLIGEIGGGIIVGGIGWFASGIPIYYQRYRSKKWLLQPPAAHP